MKTTHSQLTLLLFFTFLFTTQAVNWSNITDEEFKNLDLNEFLHLTPQELSSIPIMIFVDFTPGVVGIIPSTVWSGITLNQLKKMNPDACSGFNYDDLRNIPVKSMGGFKEDCFSNMQPRSLPGFSAEQLANIDPYQMGGFSHLHLYEITDASLLNASHVAHLSNHDYTSGCSGITTNFLGSLREEAYAGFGTQCITVSDIDVWSVVDKFKLSNIPPRTFHGFSLLQIRLMNFDAFEGFSKEQFSFLRADDDGGCRGLRKEHIDKIPAESFKGFAPECVERTRYDAFSTISRDQLSNIDPLSIRALNRNQFSSIPWYSISGLNITQVQMLVGENENSACAGFNSEHLRNIPDEAMSGLAYSCITKMYPNVMNGFRPEQIVNLSPESLSAITGDGFSHLTGSAIRALSKEQTRMLSGRTCLGILPEQIQYFTEEAISGFRSICVERLETEVFENLKPEQFKSFSQPVYKYLSSSQVGSVPPEAFSHLTAEDISGFTGGRIGPCKGLNKDQIKNIRPEAFSGLTANCLESILYLALEYLSPSQFSNISASAMIGMDEYHISLIPPETIAVLSPEQIEGFSKTSQVCNGFRNTHAVVLPPNLFAHFESNCIENWRNSFVTALSVEQIREISPRSCSGFQFFHVKAMEDDILFELSIMQLRNMEKAVRGFSSSILLDFVVKYGDEFITLYTAADYIGTFKEIMHGFKGYIAEGSIHPKYDETPIPFYRINWITVSLMKDNYPFEQRIKEFPDFLEINYAGMRPAHIRRLSPEFFSTFESIGYFTPDSARVLSREQLDALSPTAFGTIDPITLKSLPVKFIPILPVEKLNMLRRNHFEELSCEQTYSFTEEQKDGLLENLEIALDQRTDYCDKNFIIVTETSYPISSETKSTESEGSTEAPVTTESTEEGDLNSKTILILFGSVISGLLLIFIALVILSLLKRSKDRREKMRQISLLNDDE
eukprot:TRINITY_DN8028_c0_g1_i1.p1 TRINITY_DN8028_c0_g1~~TRINITY_DN8028_c0_g1_i1.p1  ORF type:complete len:956 (-),score=190.99 TRINITY_DN8028_c0_g1_i1:9-2876(-)